MIDNIKPFESLTVADIEAHPVWEFLNDDEVGDTMVRPVEKLPVETLENMIVGSPVRLANGWEVWALIRNFDVTNPRATEHFVTLAIEHNGEWIDLERYFDVAFASRGPMALARFLGLGVDDVFPITVDVRRYVLGDPAALTTIVLREPREKFTLTELMSLQSKNLL
jgi:hypothetical protein